MSQPPAHSPSLVVVIGGGISGLATAWHLTRALGADRVELLEREGRPGGTAWTEREQGYLLETGPNGFLDQPTSTGDLCDDVGLGDELVRADSAAARRFIWRAGRLRQLPGGPGQLLFSDVLSWRGKLRLFLEPLIRGRRDDAEESIEQFGRRRIGREATEVLLDAFVTGTLAGDPALLSMEASFPRLARMEREHGSLLRAQLRLAKGPPLAPPSKGGEAVESPSQGGAAVESPSKGGEGVESPPSERGGRGGHPFSATLTVPRGGMRTLMEALAQRVNARLGVEARAIESRPDGSWLVRGDAAHRWHADALVLACPAHVQAALLEPIDPQLAQDVGEIPYAPAVVVVVGFPRERLPGGLDGFGYLVPQRLGRPVLGVIWSSAIFPDQAPPGFFQFRAIVGGWRRPDVLRCTDDQLVRLVLDDLRGTLAIQAEPSFTWVRRWERAIPQYHVGHLARLARIETRLARHPGLFMTGNAFRGVSLNDCTRQASQTALAVTAYLAGLDRS